MSTLKIVSGEMEYFLSRREAAHLLSKELKEYQDQFPIVVGIPRGGVVAASEIADRLHCEMDFVLCHKLRMPFNPEVAIGAICESGEFFIHEPVSSDFMEKEKEYQLRHMAERSRNYRSVLPKTSWKGRVVVLTDDGVAMGYTVEAAIHAVRSEKPQKLILALPAGPNETIKRLSKLADHTICLSAPYFFGGVSQFYAEFPPVEDAEVMEILKIENLRKQGEHKVGAS